MGTMKQTNRRTDFGVLLVCCGLAAALIVPLLTHLLYWFLSDRKLVPQQWWANRHIFHWSVFFIMAPSCGALGAVTGCALALWRTKQWGDAAWFANIGGAFLSIIMFFVGIQATGYRWPRPLAEPGLLYIYIPLWWAVLLLSWGSRLLRQRDEN